MSKPIIVPLDGSPLAEHALVPAVTIARRLSAPLHLIRVRESDSAEVDADADTLPWDAGYLQDLRSRLEGEVDRDLLTTSELQGPVADTVITYARDASAGLIAMATRRHDGLHHTVFSSVTDKVVRHAGIPVLVCGPETTAVERPDPWECDRILVPLDGSAPSRQIVKHVGELAPGLNARVTLVRVLPQLADTVGWSAVPFNRDELAESDREAAAADLDATARELRNAGAIVDTRVVHTMLSTADAITNEAVDAGADIIALATRGRGPAKRFAFGSVAHELTKSVVAPLLLLTPDAAGGVEAN